MYSQAYLTSFPAKLSVAIPLVIQRSCSIDMSNILDLIINNLIQIYRGIFSSRNRKSLTDILQKMFC